MEARIVVSLQTSLESRVPVAVGIYNGEVTVVCPGRGGGGGAFSELQQQDTSCTLHLYRLYNPKKEPLVLYGHNSSISALALSSSGSPHPSATTLLCSAANDRLLLWNLENCYEQNIAGGSCPCRELADQPTGKEASVTYIAFSLDAQYVILCRGSQALVYSTKTCELDTTLIGHTAAVTCAVFSPHKTSEVITISDDRTFKIWDLSSSSLLYQSAIISASPFLCAAIAFHGDYLATGTADGIIRIFDLAEHQGFKCIHKFDVAKEMGKQSSRPSKELSSGESTVIDSSPHWRQQQAVVSAQDTAAVEGGSAVLGLYYWSQAADTNAHSSSASEIFKAFPLLLATTHSRVLAFNAQTMELISMIDFKGPTFSIPIAATCAFCFNPLTDEVFCALGSMFSGAVSVLVLLDTQQHQNEERPTESGATAGQEVVSVLSIAPLVSGSPLSAEFSFKTKSAPATASKTQRGRPSKSNSSSLNQPLTFKSKVKSSGYTQAPRTKMFSPKTSHQKATSSPRNRQTSEVKKLEYPTSCDPVTQLTHSFSLTDQPCAILSATFSGNGQYLACGCADKASYTVKMPPTLAKINAFVGHDGAVLSTCWNHGGEWLLTCSADKTARVWSSGHKDPLLTISTLQHNFTSTKDVKANNRFRKDITNVNFYYLDKFILLTSGNDLYLHKYHIDTSKPDDIKRYQSDSHYKLVTSLSMESAQTITAMSTINEFHSYIVLVGGSNKALCVYDMNIGACVRTIPDAHSRAVHCICQNKGSRYTSLPASAYDVFLTSAVTDGIKLWDLRMNRCVCRFTSHVNQSHLISAAISPCARFIATGSEDKTVYIYDIRYPSPLHKLTGHSDVVSTLTYHPLRPMLASATLDGKVSFLSAQ